jgi:hypothetical protein
LKKIREKTEKSGKKLGKNWKKQSKKTWEKREKLLRVGFHQNKIYLK